MATLLTIVVIIYYVVLHFTQLHDPILTQLYAGRQSTFGKACVLNKTINEINIQGI